MAVHHPFVDAPEAQVIRIGTCCGGLAPSLGNTIELEAILHIPFNSKRPPPLVFNVASAVTSCAESSVESSHAPLNWYTFDTVPPPLEISPHTTTGSKSIAMSKTFKISLFIWLPPYCFNIWINCPAWI